MLLNNYWNYLNIFGKSIPNTSDYIQVFPELKFVDHNDLNPISVQIGMYNNSTYVSTMSNNYSVRYNMGILLGTGDTAETVSDYRLDTDITSSILNFNTSVSTGVDQDVLKLTAIISGTNPSASETLTIKELGIYKNVYGNRAGNVDYYKLLFVRHVLVSPKVVPPNQGFSFAFEWIDS